MKITKMADKLQFTPTGLEPVISALRGCIRRFVSSWHESHGVAEPLLFQPLVKVPFCTHSDVLW